ncbi:hypothetical protein [Phocaeicola coprocola]|jgi:hypothetical protein|uniref:hypothetical protein n=1 Tax=Phocaeicola coprocola TaxID=310298 RepID=UPI0022E6D5F8|nr:hypothetical protein [Phocaeicola coprocola]
MSTVYVYESFYSVVVESDRHDTCLIESNRIKSLAKAFNASIVKEAKSARKGDVLSRNIMISFKAHSHETIIFREALDIIIGSINIWNSGLKAYIYDSSVERTDASFGLTD